SGRRGDARARNRSGARQRARRRRSARSPDRSQWRARADDAAVRDEAAQGEARDRGAVSRRRQRRRTRDRTTALTPKPRKGAWHLSAKVPGTFWAARISLTPVNCLV